MELNRKHFRSIIYYNFQRQLSQQECLAQLLSAFGNEAPHQSTISRWYGEFKRGRVSLSDDPMVDRHVTYREIGSSLKISKTSIEKSVHEELRVRKLVSRWIPHLLTEEQKAARVNWCQKRLDRFNSGNSKNVYSIVSGDESWIYCYEPENKRQSAVWVIRSRSVSKKNQRIVTADWYTTIYNASSHTAQNTRQYLTEENVELLDHPPYKSPEEAWCRQPSLWDQEWNSIVFSDESRFCLGMHDGRARVRRRRGERRNPQFFVERHAHHTVGVMVWGAIAYGSRSPLIFIRGNMNAQRYIHKVLEPHLLPYLDTLADPTFQQDNARPHVSRVTIDFFQHNDVTLLPWPPKSPDLSPIEHVWDMMGRRLLHLQRPPQTLKALREELVVAWNEIPQEDIDHLIRSMPRRVGECYHIRVHPHIIKGQRALKQCNHFESFIIYLLCFIKDLYTILLK
ncbi:unnamed protein product [Acanthoscelides obtectus]|uniref:Transposase n=1 Tax=Acanthoscelides obtectus TaxID=200917 RepID=A0A9P0LL59_ACAOB|nr:unnamed protein product [Acanthoscelides obtectus]CAK1679197.1 Transposable element Tc3 transposase [Acanthoscelides obtectus]